MFLEMLILYIFLHHKDLTMQEKFV